MSIPNEALQKVLQEIGQKKAFAEQQLVIVKQQKAIKSRESRVLQLTSNELESLPKETKVYEGVGKMFVCTPIPDVQKRLAAEGEDLKAGMSDLDKKEDYLEKTYQNSKNSIEQVLRGTGGN
ncbi:Prefoldin [Dendryphion nanum]|uniref:Prefoldin n=1 Tax=Dendryphion nanum TaxID=256645 RepID=A0A9P9D811_9PLEO|nr:Prefoldin [Dendryphion nanum]